MTAENKRVSASNYQMLLSPRVNLSCCLFFPPASQKKANFASYRPIFCKIPSKFSARNTVPARVLSHSQICQPAQFSLRSGYFEDRLRWALLICKTNTFKYLPREHALVSQVIALYANSVYIHFFFFFFSVMYSLGTKAWFPFDRPDRPDRLSRFKIGPSDRDDHR